MRPLTNFSRSAALGMTATEHLSPARLKVLLGAMSVIVRSAISGSSDAIGVWRLPPRVSSQWISSATIASPRRRQICARLMSSSRVKTRPTGLCGLQSRKKRVRSPIAVENASRSTS